MQTITIRPRKTLHLAACMLALTTSAQPASPPLSVSLFPPASVMLSWPSNFTSANWQLTSATNMDSADWQPVAQTPVLSGDTLAVLFPFTDPTRYFRLQQTGGGGGGGGGCTLQATPSVITAGASSTLTWCSQPGTTYSLSPGPGIVTGGSFPVSPTLTTVYSLTSSNASGVATDFASVIVDPCGWVQVKNWQAKLYFDYLDFGSTAGFNFSIKHRVGLTDDITFNLTLQAGSTATDAYYFGTATGGSASINDREDIKTPMLFTTTEVGSGPPVLLASYLSLHVTCTSYDFNYNVVMNTTETDQTGVTTLFEGAGTGVMASRLLPATNSISGSESVLAEYPPVDKEYFVPNSDLGTAAFTAGVLPSTDDFLNHALVQWEFTPAQ